MLTHHPGDRWAIHVISNSDEHEVIGIRWLANAALPKGVRTIQVALVPCANGPYHHVAALHSEK